MLLNYINNIIISISNKLTQIFYMLVSTISDADDQKIRISKNLIFVKFSTSSSFLLETRGFWNNKKSSLSDKFVIMITLFQNIIF